MPRTFKEIRHLIDYEKILQDMGFETFLERDEVWTSCPFTDNHKNGDTRPSFSVNVGEGDRQGLWNCFVCGGGDFAQLLSELNGESYEDALLGLTEVVREGNMVDLKDELLRVLDAKDPKTTDQKREGYVIPQYIHHEWMDQFTPEAVEHFGLTYDEARDGVIIPHYWKGVLVGWQIRLFSGKSKYINTPNFPKRNTLFGYDEARNYSHVIVVEGPKTVIKLWGLGVRNAVATFGASVTDEQMTTLMGFDKVSTWFDNDEAGKMATEYVLDGLAGVCDVGVLPFVPGDKSDPADLNSEEEVQAYLKRRRSYLELALNQ